MRVSSVSVPAAKSSKNSSANERFSFELLTMPMNVSAYWRRFWMESADGLEDHLKIDDGVKRLAVRRNEDNMDRLASLVGKKRANEARGFENDALSGRGSLDTRPGSPSLFRARHQHRCEIVRYFALKKSCPMIRVAQIHFEVVPNVVPIDAHIPRSGN
jgi:hypothetical protein